MVEGVTFKGALWPDGRSNTTVQRDSACEVLKEETMQRFAAFVGPVLAQEGIERLERGAHAATCIPGEIAPTPQNKSSF